MAAGNSSSPTRLKGTSVPELPEVETVRRGLAPYLEGAQIAALYATAPGKFPFVFRKHHDERLAMAVHRLVRGFWRWYYRVNIETD